MNKTPKTHQVGTDLANDQAPTMKSAAARLGVSVAAVKAAKAAGCEAFKSSGRVTLTVLRDWLNQHAEAVKTATTDSALKRRITETKLAREQAKLRADKVEADEREGLVIKRELVKQELWRFIGNLKAKQQNIPRALACELAMLSDPIQIEERIRTSFRASWESLTTDDDLVTCPHCKKTVV